ncbi:MAG: phosphoglycerate kinase [Deltaproteobacteria bacterium]|nr:phosphoglycerate kinase [Deltaproteobacteria bacterium]
MQYLNDLKIKNKKVLIRVDMNVPLDKNQNITDDNRIRAVLPTVNYALDENAKVILCSHIGRPKGKVVPELSLAPVARRLSRLLQKEVLLAPDCVGPEVKKIIDAMKPGDIVLLENLRFHPEETKNDEDFGRELAALADIYVNDAFAVAHRAHASVVAVAKFAQKVAAGFLMKDELKFFYQSMERPARPLVAVIGGSKVSGKLEALENLLENVDKLVIGGAMANTFLKGVNYYVGQSLIEEDLVSVANCLMRRAKENQVKLYIPVDCVVAPKMDPQAETKITPIQEVPRDWMILDIGPATSLLYAEVLQNAKTIIWNGPMGAFEMDAFSRGTMAMVQAVANSYALTIVGGGDTDVAVHKAGETSKISYISTGGGAFLALLEGSQLPGVAALDGKFVLKAHERPDSCLPKTIT